jgi:hypothetical protein
MAQQVGIRDLGAGVDRWRGFCDPRGHHAAAARPTRTSKGIGSSARPVSNEDAQQTSANARWNADNGHSSTAVVAISDSLSTNPATNERA